MARHFDRLDSAGCLPKTIIYNLAKDRSELQDMVQKEQGRVKSISRRWEELNTRYTQDGIER